MADVTKGGNIVNIHDFGRWIGQSYYSLAPNRSAPDPGWKDWPWNPVGAGDVYCNPSKMIEKKNDGKTLYVKSVPRRAWITCGGTAGSKRGSLRWTPKSGPQA